MVKEWDALCLDFSRHDQVLQQVGAGGATLGPGKGAFLLW